VIALTDEEILSRLDSDDIAAAAVHAAHVLAQRGAAVLELTPGDSTVYRIMLAAPWIGTWTTVGTKPRKNFWVALLNCSGTGYEWTGEHVDPDYAAAKWTHNDHRWTGVVLAAFLNTLADVNRTSGLGAQQTVEGRSMVVGY